MKVLIALLLTFITALPMALAQATRAADGGAVMLGWARVADTSGVEIGGRLWHGPYATGVHFDGAFAFDFTFGHRVALYDVLDADVGYSIGFGVDAPTCLILRAGGSWWLHGDRQNGLGENLGFEVRHLVSSKYGWVVDLDWRRFSGFTLPRVTIGLAAY